MKYLCLLGFLFVGCAMEVGSTSEDLSGYLDNPKGSDIYYEEPALIDVANSIPSEDNHINDCRCHVESYQKSRDLLCLKTVCVGDCEGECGSYIDVCTPNRF